MTPRRTTTTYALLGLLGVRSWTTYELAKQIQRSLNWFWPRAERKLYDEPKRLVARRAGHGHQGGHGQAPADRYGITDAGREELRRWLDEPPAPPTIEFEGLVKIFFAEAGSLDQLNATLDAIAAEATARLEALAVMADSGVESPSFPERLHIGALPMRLSLEHEATVLRWVRVGAAAGRALDRHR